MARQIAASGAVPRLIGALLALATVAAGMGGSGPAAADEAKPLDRYCIERTLDDGRPRHLCISLANYNADVCKAIGRFADDYDLPRGYFARLIWQESHFNANAVSSAGAQGIAQFMPGTGRLQGLVNPFDPVEELWRSARYLRALANRFGNLGLAAAAYNGGEGAASRFIAGTGYLAYETLQYVMIITGIPVTRWLDGEVRDADYELSRDKPFLDACVEMASTGGVTRFTPPTTIVRPWGIQIAQFFSPATARRAFERVQDRFDKVLGSEELMLVAKRNPNFGPALRYTAEIGRDSRAEAEKLCALLLKAGGACIVVRN